MNGGLHNEMKHSVLCVNGGLHNEMKQTSVKNSKQKRRSMVCNASDTHTRNWRYWFFVMNRTTLYFRASLWYRFSAPISGMCVVGISNVEYYLETLLYLESCFFLHSVRNER